jgi:hypothetical protein
VKSVNISWGNQFLNFFLFLLNFQNFSGFLSALACGDTKMNTNDNKIEDSGEFEVDDKFAADLKAIYGSKRSIPSAIDNAVLGEARSHLAKKHSRLKFARWAVSAAAAAVIVFAFVLNFDGNKTKPMAEASAIKEDIDRNGRVDILDAFVLARRVESGGAVDLKLDINGDGIVDHKDIDAVAARAVRLKKGA